MAKRCKSCDCCFAEFEDAEDASWCTGCYANYGRRAECDDCPKHTLLYAVGRDGHRVKEIVLGPDAPSIMLPCERCGAELYDRAVFPGSCPDCGFDVRVRVTDDESPRGWEPVE